MTIHNLVSNFAILNSDEARAVSQRNGVVTQAYNTPGAKQNNLLQVSLHFFYYLKRSTLHDFSNQIMSLQAQFDAKILTSLNKKEHRSGVLFEYQFYWIN